MRIFHVVGARPNFMKIAPIMRAFARNPDVEQALVHTGQHYDEDLSGGFFSDLDLPKPDFMLGVGSGSHGVQTGRILISLEPLLARETPDWVLMVGDVNSTLAGALAAVKLGIPVAHVEAGLRSFDRRMPEEVNRIVTDAISTALFTTEASGTDNLVAEGIDNDRIFFVGNVMIDTLDRLRPRAAQLRVHEALGVDPGRYVVVTLHRPENVDDPSRLGALLAALAEVAYVTEVPIIFPMHPRTARNIRRFNLDDGLAPLLALTPLGYLDFLSLLDTAGLVLSDSGGVQEETTVMGVPCITLRETTDRPITLTAGTNRLFQDDLDRLPEWAVESLALPRRPCRPPQWDGRAAERIAEVMIRDLGAGSVVHAAARQAAL